MPSYLKRSSACQTGRSNSFFAALVPDYSWRNMGNINNQAIPRVLNPEDSTRLACNFPAYKTAGTPRRRHAQVCAVVFSLYGSGVSVACWIWATLLYFELRIQIGAETLPGAMAKGANLMEILEQARCWYTDWCGMVWCFLK